MLTKQDLVKRISGATGVDRRRANLVLDALVELTRSSLRNGERVRIPGLGTFSTAIRSPRRTRNPRTGQEIVVPAGKRVRFSAAADLRRLVAEGAGE